MTDDPLLTPSQAAKRLGVCTETIKRWMQKGVLVYERYRGNRYRRVRQSVVDAQLSREHVARETTTDDSRL